MLFRSRLTAPAPGSTFVEDETIPVIVEASDDIAVAAVEFLVNGQMVFTDTSAPYRFDTVAPIVSTGSEMALTLGARAVDLGGNIGAAENVVIKVIPDPGTTVEGQIVTRKGDTVAGATVTCLGVSGTTDVNGTFSLAQVPTVQKIGRASCRERV